MHIALVGTRYCRTSVRKKLVKLHAERHWFFSLKSAVCAAIKSTHQGRCRHRANRQQKQSRWVARESAVKVDVNKFVQRTSDHHHLSVVVHSNKDLVHPSVKTERRQTRNFSKLCNPQVLTSFSSNNACLASASEGGDTACATKGKGANGKSKTLLRKIDAVTGTHYELCNRSAHHCPKVINVIIVHTNISGSGWEAKSW